MFNFTTTYAKLRKRTADIYLYKIFHLAKSWGLSHRVYKGINKKLKMSQIAAQFRPFLNTSKNSSVNWRTTDPISVKLAQYMYNLNTFLSLTEN